MVYVGNYTKGFASRLGSFHNADANRATEINDDEAWRIRNDFPALTQQRDGGRFIYLDSAATSQNPLSVIRAEQSHYMKYNAAVHRGTHLLAEEATNAFELARAQVAAFINAECDEIVWTSNATGAINLLAYAFSNAAAGLGGMAAEPFNLKPGDEIVITEMEHHANIVPWQQTAARTGATLKYIPIDKTTGGLDMEAAERLITGRTKVVAFSHVSNVLGNINPVEKICSLSHGQGALVVLDACQSAPHMPLDVKKLNVDFAVFSGHKMLAPTGIGVLYGKLGLLNAMPPFLTGGAMITEVTMEQADFLPAPRRFEAGTPPVSQAVALAAAIEYLLHVGMDRIRQREAFLGQRLVAGLEGIQGRGVRFLGPRPGVERVGLAAVHVDDIHAHDLGQYLDSQGIAVRVGHHCAQPLHRRYGIAATARASAYLYNTTDDIDAFIAAVAEAQLYFTRRHIVPAA